MRITFKYREKKARIKMSANNRKFESEFSFKTSRSSGAGGQHVNTTETKVELSFLIQDSIVLTEEEKEKFTAKWKNRINDDGEFKICSSQHRSQAANKEHVIKKFYKMLATALLKEKKRIATKKPKAVKEKILKIKKRNSEKKTDRGKRTRDFM